MNKLIKIMFILCLCMANYASASNKDDRNNPNGSEDFNKMKHAWLKRFESENKTEEKNEVVQNFNQDLVKHQELFKNLKNELITEAKRMKEERIKKTVEQNILENENNKFLQLFNMGTISSGVISCLDLQSVECLQKICKKTRSKTIDILEKFPQLAQKLLNIDLAIHKDALFLYAQNTLYGENAVKNGAKDDIFRLLWDLGVGREDPLDFLDSLKKYQNLLCNLTGEHKPKWINGAINEIHEQIIETSAQVWKRRDFG